MLSTLLESIFPTAHADEEEKPQKEEEESKEEGGAAEEEEEEEVEDFAPALREECAESAACSGFNKHFQHCTEKVTSGQGYKGEDCVEELFHLMHCVDNCIAPKVFSKLR